MRSTLACGCRRTTAANAPKRISCATILVAGQATFASPASALVIQPVTPLQQQIKQDSPVIDVVVHHGGAAIGFVAAGTAVAWAGAPPAPGYCWYYTDPSRTQGFWDACP